jgi:nucleoside-diphosphate-sugar epimerase
VISPKKSIIISGASGFSGQHLLRLIDTQIYEPIIVKRESNEICHQIIPNIKELDIENEREVADIVSTGNIQAVYHLATLYRRESEEGVEKEIWNVNFSLGHKLLNIAEETNSLFIHAESYLQFEQVPNTVYLESKRAFSELVNSERNKSNLRAASLVFFDNYGPFDGRNKLLDQLIQAKSKDAKMVIENPDKCIVLTSIADVMRSNLSLLEGDLKGRFRVNSSEKFLIRDLRDYIYQFPNKDKPVSVGQHSFRAEQLELLPTFRQTDSVFEYLYYKLGIK